MAEFNNPDFPAGPFQEVQGYSDVVRNELIEAHRSAPADLKQAVAGLSEEQLETKYRNWTIRQIVHHVADSHLNSYVRYKWALTENHPTIKAYNEAEWVELADSKSGDIAPSIALLEGLHAKWTQLLESMTPDQFDLTFHHPESDETVRLWTALHYYPWHARHHTGQILWVRESIL